MITHEQPGYFPASLSLSPPRPHSVFHQLEIHCLVAGLGHSIKNCSLDSVLCLPPTVAASHGLWSCSSPFTPSALTHVVLGIFPGLGLGPAHPGLVLPWPAHHTQINFQS